VQQAAEVRVRVGIAGIELDRTPIRITRLFGVPRLELATELVPVFGREARRRALRVLRTSSCERRDALRELGDVEGEQLLARLRVPAPPAVTRD
jgi:hypothetical protein